MKSELAQDLLFALVSSVVVFSPAVKFFWDGHLPFLLISCAAGPGAGLLVSYLILRCPTAYLKHRTALLTVVKCLRLATAAAASALYAHRGYRLHVISSGTPLARSWPIAILLWKPMLLLLSGLGFPLPLYHHLWVQTLALAVSLGTNPRRCASEAGEAYYHELYPRLANGISRAMTKLMPVTTPTRRESLAPVSNPSACLLVQAWFQLVVGYLLPLLALDWSQAPAGGGPRSPDIRSARGAVVYCGLLALGAIEAWKGAELWLQPWRQAS